MARLPRVKQKIFAGTAAANQVTAFGTIKSGTPSYTTSAADIMNSNFESGWSAAVEGDYAPYRQDRNAVDTATTQQLAYIFQEGVAEWDSNTVYYNGSVAKLIDGTTVKFYRSIADNNTSTLNNTTKWVLFLNISNTGVITAPTINNITTIGTITTPLTASRAIVTNGSKQLTASSTTSTEIGYVHGVTSAIQTQINAKQNTLVSGTSIKTVNSNSLLGSGDVVVQATITGAATTVTSSNLTANRALVSNSSGKIAVSSITSTKLGYLSDVTSNIQAQINATMKAPNTTNPTDVTKANGTVSADGYFYLLLQGGTFKINNLEVTLGAAYNIYTQIPFIIPVKAGDTYSSTNWATVITFKYMPFRS